MEITCVFVERRAYPGACIVAASAAIAGDDECRDSGRRERGSGECIVERTTSVIAATTPRPWCGNTCACSTSCCAQSSRNQPRESAKFSHPRVPEQYCWWVWLVSIIILLFSLIRAHSFPAFSRKEEKFK